MSRYEYCQCNRCGAQPRCRFCGRVCCDYPDYRLGPTGPEGPQGIQGLQGERGPQGAAGPRGLRGLQGPLGLQGPQGVPGARGEAGPQGLQGERGLQGEQGPRGEQGLQGEFGPTGPAGLQGTQGIQGVDGPQGETGPQGLPGPVAATIPFSIGKYGIQLSTDAQGQPYNVTFSGFSASGYYSAEYLQEGEWASRKITLTEDMDYGPAFVMPYSGKLQNIYVVISLEMAQEFSENAIIHPFVCLATSNSDELVYDVLEDTIITVDPFVSGIAYRRHTLRRGEKTGLDIDLPAGTLVAIIMGITAENVETNQYCNLSVSGGIYLQ